jgi:muramoyltetrapeptide carboxypeptidase
MIKLNLPHRLKKGDKVAITCPSLPVGSILKFKKALKELENLGILCELGNTVKEKGGFRSTSDVERADELNSFFERKEIKAIFCAIGGECSIELLNLINYDVIKKNPKIFMGMSDITILLNAIYTKTGLITFCGPNIENGFDLSQINKKGIGEYTKKYLINTLFNSLNEIEIIPKKKWKIIKEGFAEGTLIGGNLFAISAILDTPYISSWERKIWFWEETYEEPSTINFFLQSYKIRNIFNKIHGIIIGKNWRCYNRNYKESPTVDEIILDLSKELNIPIISGVDFGHNCESCVLPLGAKASIDTHRKEIKIFGPVVK